VIFAITVIDILWSLGYKLSNECWKGFANAGCATLTGRAVTEFDQGPASEGISNDCQQPQPVFSGAPPLGITPNAYRMHSRNATSTANFEHRVWTGLEERTPWQASEALVVTDREIP